MNSYIGKASQLASRWLTGPISTTPSMADIAPRFQQIDVRENNTSQTSPRFQTPGWARALADFLPPASQAATDGAPLVMQMSGKGESSVSKPRSSDPEEWRCYYWGMSQAGLQYVLHDKRDEMIAFIRREAEQLNRTFAEVIPLEVRSIDPLDIEYWERIELCLFKPCGYGIIDDDYPSITLEEFLTDAKFTSQEWGQLFQVISERARPLIEELGLIELWTIHEAAKMLTHNDGTYRVTHEQLEQALADQPDACAVRRGGSDSLFDALPDEDVERCPDPLGD